MGVVWLAVLGRASVHVEIVERLRWIGTGGDDEAGVRSFGQGFGFVDDAALPLPTAGLIGGLAHQAHRLAGLGLLRAGLGAERSGHRLQAAVWNQANGVGQALPLTVGVERRDGAAAVGT